MLNKLKTQILMLVHKSVYKPGHYYSPLPDMHEVAMNNKKIYKREPPKDVDMRPEAQQGWLTDILRLYALDFKWPATKQDDYLYYYENNFFNKSDAFALFAMMRSSQAKKIIEVGSGFSSMLMLDTNRLFLNNAVQLKFIEPYPDRFSQLLAASAFPKENFELIQKKIQDVPASDFAELEANDILFIDSSHVSKLGSDLNYLLFEVLPYLKKGVIIHFHDVIYPFEYPASWAAKGIFWNEAYLLHAFLMNNNAYKIKYMSSAFEDRAFLPLVVSGSGGSLWLEKVS